MKTTVTLLIAASLTFNSLVSLRGLELPAKDALESAVAVEFTVLSFLSVSSLPFRILNDIAAPAGFGAQKKSSRSQEKKKRNDVPSDRPMPSYEANAKGADQGKGIYCAGTPCLSSATAAAAGGFWSHLIRGVTAPPVFFLLSYLVVLSRSNLPWEKVSLLPFKSPVPA
ncbi:MAG: hypothetical protein ACYC5N_07995 [Endomicrobiales bacterium]